MQDISLPDYEEMLSLADQIRKAIVIRDHLDHEIKARESEIYRITSSDSSFFVNGKPPSAAFVKSAYEYPGLTGELLDKRQAHSEACALVEFLRLSFDVMKMQIDLYRTESANRRNSTL